MHCPSPTHLVLACLALLSGSVFADTVLLQSGEKVEGKITAESDAQITINAKISASITDERVIKRSEIKAIMKDAPDEVAWQSLKSLKPGRSSLPLAAYDSVLNPVRGFLNEFPQSKFAPDAQKIADTFSAEKKRVEAGEVKLDDKWLSKEEVQKERVQLGGLIAFNAMKEQSARDMTAAMNAFDAIEKNYGGTRAYPDAIEYALKMLPTLKAEVERRNKALNERKAEREKSLSQSTGPQRTALQDEIKREQAAAEAVVSAAEKQSLKWLPMNPPTERGLSSLSSRIPSEMQRLASAPVAKMRSSIQAAEKAKTLLEKKEVEAAEAALSQATNDWSANELALRLQPEVQVARTALAAAKTAEEPAPVPDAPVLTENKPAPSVETPATEEAEAEKSFFLTPAGAVTAVVLVGLLIAAYKVFKQVKSKANDVLE